MTRTCPVLLSDNDLLSTRELASFLPAFRIIYAISNEYFGNTSEEEILKKLHEYMPKLKDICSGLTFEEALSSFGDVNLGENELSSRP